MKKVNILLVVLNGVLLGSCTSKNAQNEFINVSDTSKYVIIANERVVPKETFQFITSNKFNGDTLDLVSCSEYVYSPFGKITNEGELKSSLLNRFSVVSHRQAETLNFYELKFGQSNLVLSFDNDTEAAQSSYLVKGEIYDGSIVSSNGIKVGMSSVDFYRTFFSSFSDKLQKKYNVVIIESCVIGLKHIYTFDGNKITSVKFECVDCSYDNQ